MRGDGLGGSLGDDGLLQVSPRCLRRSSPARRLRPTSLYLPGRRRWLKITPRPRALQRAARAAKGKDNVLAALIGVCGCHILITSFKKKKKDDDE